MSGGKKSGGSVGVEWRDRRMRGKVVRAARVRKKREAAARQQEDNAIRSALENGWGPSEVGAWLGVSGSAISQRMPGVAARVRRLRSGGDGGA